MFRNSFNYDNNCYSQCYLNTFPKCCCCLIGPPGPMGPQGTGTVIKGSGESKQQLDTDFPDGPAEDAYIVDGEIYIWNQQEGWHSAGSLKGPEGPTGPQGPQGFPGPQGDIGPQGEQGIGTTIKGSAESKQQLDIDHPDGPPEDAYLVDGEIYIWNQQEGWHSAGSLKGDSRKQVMYFSSVNSTRVQTGVSGLRSTCSFVGVGAEQIVSVADPVNALSNALALKIFENGTITRIDASVSLTLAATDAVSNMHVQLYKAINLTSQLFEPIPETSMTFTIPYNSPAGMTFNVNLTNLSIPISEGNQLYLGFYNTSQSLTAGIQAYMCGSIIVE